MEFQENEIVMLFMAFTTSIILMFIIWKKDIPDLRLFHVGFLFMVCAYIFTVVEGIFWNEFFNNLEHLSYALAGLIFAGGCFSLMRHSKKSES